jgi:hypothetical protein
VKNSNEDEPARLNIERDPLLLLALTILCAGLAYLDYFLFKAVNPLAFLVMIPAAILSFQVLWLFLHPFALVFENRFEIKHSLFSNKMHHFIDIKKLSESKGKWYITYTDDDIERLNLFGIKKAHVELLKAEIEKQIAANTHT